MKNYNFNFEIVNIFINLMTKSEIGNNKIHFNHTPKMVKSFTDNCSSRKIGDQILTNLLQICDNYPLASVS